MLVFNGYQIKRRWFYHLRYLAVTERGFSDSPGRRDPQLPARHQSLVYRSSHTPVGQDPAAALG